MQYIEEYLYTRNNQELHTIGINWLLDSMKQGMKQDIRLIDAIN